MAMEVAPQHNWAEMVEETVEEALIIRGARRSANVDGVVVNEDKVSSGSDGEEASKDKTKNNIYFNEGKKTSIVYTAFTSIELKILIQYFTFDVSNFCLERVTIDTS